MKKWIRWKGLIGFVIAVLVLVLFFVVFIDLIIKSGIEAAGTRVVGAKVELDNAEFRFSPLGLRLDRLQVTNPVEPMQNILDIKQIRFNMDGLNLLRRKVLINEMQVDGVRLNTARSTSGAVKRRSKPKPKQDAAADKDNGFKLPDIAIPDVDKILAREELKTPEQASQLKSDVKTSQQNWDKIKDKLPGEKQADAYKERIERLKQTDTRDIGQITEAIKELKTVKEDISADLNYIDTSRKQISDDLSRLDGELKALKKSPQEEYERLSRKYTASADNIGNISRLLFGDEAKKYTDLAMYWYKQIEPWLAYVDFSGDETPPVARHEGLDIRFKEDHPQPDFLIKLVRASVVTDKGRFDGQIKDITNEQDITRKPTSLRFAGDRMQGIGSILVTGTFNRIQPANARDELNFNMRDYQLHKYRLIDKQDMTVSLDKAKSDVKLTAQRKNNTIGADFTAHIHSIQYNNQASGNELAMLFLSSIKQTRDFNLYGKLRGTFNDYSVRLSSDLDERLKANMRRHMDRRLAGFKKELRDEINAKTRAPIQEAESKVKDYQSGIKNDLAMREARLTQQLNTIKAEINQKEQQIKQQGKDKLEEKLKGLLNKYK